jgi:hypothetical protein
MSKRLDQSSQSISSAAAKVFSKTAKPKNLWLLETLLTLSQIGCPDEGIKFLGPLSIRCAKSM